MEECARWSCGRLIRMARFRAILLVVSASSVTVSIECNCFIMFVLSELYLWMSSIVKGLLLLFTRHFWSFCFTNFTIFGVLSTIEKRTGVTGPRHVVCLLACLFVCLLACLPRKKRRLRLQTRIVVVSTPAKANRSINTTLRVCITVVDDYVFVSSKSLAGWLCCAVLCCAVLSCPWKSLCNPLVSLWFEQLFLLCEPFTRRRMQGRVPFNTRAVAMSPPWSTDGRFQLSLRYSFDRRTTWRARMCANTVHSGRECRCLA